MNKEDYVAWIRSQDGFHNLIEEIDNDNIVYNRNAVWVDPEAPDFLDTKTHLNDEEAVRAAFLLLLSRDFEYELAPRSIELEHVYQAPGRPRLGAKGCRADIIARDGQGNPYLFIELKTPDEYSNSRKLIDGQLFQASKLEDVTPKYLVWATVVFRNGAPVIQSVVIPRSDWVSYAEWHEAGEPAGNMIPKNFGTVIRCKYANVSGSDGNRIPLDHSCNESFFSGLVTDLHDVLWGGGGTSSNEVFAILTKLMLCKAYDEKETHSGEDYRFQVRYINDSEVPSELLVEDMNEFYIVAAKSYLGIEQRQSLAFDTERIKPSKIAYAVRRLEGISITKNDYDGDLLGKFFEEIVAHGFTQTRGQFFTPQKLVDFMLDLAAVQDQAESIITNNPDGLGVRRFPYVIDPSCGVGTFLNSYMRKIVGGLNSNDFKKNLTDRELEAVEAGFAGRTHTSWAKSSLYGIESNHDLGLAAKVNMILHGDGSMNTFVKSGLLRFEEYQVEGRPQNVLGIPSVNDSRMNGKFDLVLSNPPFSIKLTEDDKNEIESAFSGDLGLSEDLFIERWWQLLNEGGRFCCVLPESVLDTKRELGTRLWLLARFKILAVVSLPYSAFQPYTSVKTCIVYAQKRTKRQSAELINSINSRRGVSAATLPRLLSSFKEAGALGETTFFAEPDNVGYKRRKGLADLERPSDLPDVSSRFNDGFDSDDSKLGFVSTLEDIISRPSVRLDPKYRWLWDKQNGEVHISNIGDASIPLSKWFQKVDLEKMPKGELDKNRLLIDLDAVDARSGRYAPERAKKIDSIGSDKVLFDGCDIAISKLEPYLGKVIINPPSEAIGTTEWVGLKCQCSENSKRLGYCLMLPQLLDAYRRLQSGKRHARLDINEVLELKVDIDPLSVSNARLTRIEENLSELELQQRKLRESIDSLYNNSH